MAQNRFTAYVNSLTGLTRTQHAVLRMFAQYTDNETGEGFPSLATLAAGTLLARSTVQLAMEELQEKGYLEFVRKRKTQNFWVNVYRVVLGGIAPIQHADESTIPTGHRTDHRTDPVSPYRREDSRNQKVDRTDTDSIGNELDQVCSLPVSQDGNPKPQTLISTDPLSPYVAKVLARFARYKSPGRDAEQYAREILADGMFIGNNPQDHSTFLPAQQATVGDLATRHLIDMIGWVFEINAYDTSKGAFRWAERTHTMKNLRDHLLKEKSPLFGAYANWCCDFDGYKFGTRGSVGYALGTLGEQEFVEYNKQIRDRIARYKAAKAAGKED